MTAAKTQAKYFFMHRPINLPYFIVPSFPYFCTLGIFLKRILFAGFPIYYYHFLVIHTVYSM